MRQAYRNLLIISTLLMIVFPSWALAVENIKNNDHSKLPKVNTYLGKYDSNLKEELVNDNSQSIGYKGRIFSEVGTDFTYFLWNTTANITSTVKTREITIQLKDNDYDNGYLLLYIDNNYLGEVNTKSNGSMYIQITNLPYDKHTITLKQREGHIHFDWIGFGAKKGDINPPTTWLSFSPELVNGLGGQDTEVIFITEDDINEEIEPSGISRTLYSIDGNPWLEYMGPFNLNEGRHQIRYFSVDNNNNNENINYSNIIIKTTAPEIAFK